ncbi:transposase, MuDR, MULE transposase domain protein [Tanacetum coccineum]
MSTKEYIRKVIEDVGEDDDFTRALWLSVLDHVNEDGEIVTGCFGDVKKFIKNGKLEKVVAVIKSCTPNVLGDLTVTLKDFSGTIFGTIHYNVLTEERFAKVLFVRACQMHYTASALFPPTPKKYPRNVFNNV